MTTLTIYFKRFFSGVMLSRISGLARDLSMAYAFGAHPSVAAFLIAFRLSNLLRRLMAEGPLQSTFIPYFEQLRLKDNEKALFFFKKLTFYLLVFLISTTLLFEIVTTFIPSYFQISLENQEILSLSKWLFPAIIFICLYGLNTAFLYCYDTFFLPSIAPMICNIFWITGAIYLKNIDPNLAMPTLCKFVVVGFFGQWLLTLPLTLRYVSTGLKLKKHFTIPVEVKQLYKAFCLGAIGVGAVQINSLIDVFFARYAHISGPVYLSYSIRFYQLALATLGIACISTIVPRLSRAIKIKDTK